MNPFTIDPSDSLIFNVSKGHDVESVITVSNVGKKNLIFCVKTNSKSQFVVRPTKFYIEPESSRQVTFTIKKGKLDGINFDELPRRDKVEFDALYASTILVNEIKKQQDKARDLIRNRFKACEDSNKFKSCDYDGEIIEEDASVGNEIFKKRIPIIYKDILLYILNSEITDAPLPTFEAPKEAIQEVQEVHKSSSQKTQIVMILFFLFWSAFVFFLGTRIG